jgi:hypothetical protein
MTKDSLAPSSDTWGRRLFRAGGVWLIVLGLVHSISLIKPMVPANDTERQLLDLMVNYKFNLMGSMRSMMDLLRGFSVAFMLGALGFGAFDLTVARERAGLLKRVALINALWLAFSLAAGLHYFFAAPNSFIAVGLILFALAWVKLPGDGAA